MYTAKVIQANHITAHPRADRIKLLHYGEGQFVIGLDVQEGDLVVLFPSDGQLSNEFCYENNLYRDSAMNRDMSKTGFFEDTRRVRAQPFRGEKSYGFVATFESFSYLKNFTPDVGMEFSEWNGHEICQKYYTPATLKAMRNVENNKAKKKTVSYAMKEHIKTKKLMYNTPDVQPNTVAIISEKIHGTSGRTANCLVTRRSRNIFQFILSSIARKFVGKESVAYELVTGTRRTVCNNRLDITTAGERDYYRWEWHEVIAPQLHKGETVYYEIAGYDSWGAGIMDAQNIAGRKDTPDYWDDRMEYSYGCLKEMCENDAYVYRITRTNESGVETELSWSQTVARTLELGLKTVPVLEFFIPDNTENLLNVINTYMTDSPSTVDNRHLMEGIVIRLESQTGVEILKNKNHLFGILEGYLKEDEDYVDVEEAN